MPPARTIARDALVSLAAVSALALDVRTRATGASGPAALALGATAGILVAVAGFLLHEWGHWLGARWTGSVVHYPRSVLAPLLFHFDTRANDRRQFLAMSLGGYLASVVGVGLVVALTDRAAWSGRVALALTVGGMLVTAALEIPTTVRVLRGRPLPDGFAYRPPG
jgi:membrane-associated protease RseP (regulator of RpoE activity)